MQITLANNNLYFVLNKDYKLTLNKTPASPFTIDAATALTGQICIFKSWNRLPLFLLSYFPFYKRNKNISISFATSCTLLYTMILEKKIIIPNIISSALLCYSLDLQRTSNLNKPLAIWCWLVISPLCQNKNKTKILQLHTSNWNWWGDSSDQLFSNKTMKFLEWETWLWTGLDLDSSQNSFTN